MATSLSGYRALGTIDPTSGLFTEMTAGGYARQAVTLINDGSGHFTNSAALTYGPATGADWPSVSAVAIYDALTGGNLILYYGLGGSSFVVPLGTSRVLAAGGIGLTFPSGGYTPHGTPIQLGEDVAVSGNSIITTARVVAPTSKTGAYSPVLSDNGSTLISTDATGVTYTLGTGATPGTTMDVIQGGAGAIAFAAGAGATVSNRQSFVHTAGLNAVARVRAISATAWITSGDMTT